MSGTAPFYGNPTNYFSKFAESEGPIWPEISTEGIMYYCLVTAPNGVRST